MENSLLKSEDIESQHKDHKHDENNLHPHHHHHLNLKFLHRHHHRPEWSNPIEFLMTCIGSL